MPSTNRKLILSLALRAVLVATGSPVMAQGAAAVPRPNVQNSAPAPRATGQQELVYHQGESVLMAGLALGGINGSVGSASIPPLFGGLEYGLHPDVSVGGIASYYQASTNYGYGRDWKYTYLTVGGRADYHFGRFVPVEKLDLYGGMMLAYSVVSVSNASSSYPGASATSSSNIIVWGLDVGARYFFTKALAAQLELGVGLGNISLGLAYKM